MLAEPYGNPYLARDAPKLRTACENCRQSKVKCNLSGKNACTRCLRHGLQCQYGFANRSGKPKGSKNRATLRKLGQLQEEKSGCRFRSGRGSGPVADMEPLVPTVYTGRFSEPLDDDVCLMSGQSGLWESSRSFDSAATLETSLCPGQLRPETLQRLDGSALADVMDPSCASPPAGFEYPNTPATPTFLSQSSMTAKTSGLSLVDSISSSYLQPPCECVERHLFHMDRLSHLVAQPVPLRFDHSLQAIRTSFYACQMFLQCSKCAKDSSNLLLTISALNLTLQLFEYWVSQETSRTSRPDSGPGLRYGYYEIGYEENRQIRKFLIRGLLLQCRSVLSALKVAINSASLLSPKTVDGERSTGPTTTEDRIGWMSFGATVPDLDPDFLNSTPGSSCLLSIVVGYEATVEAFLYSMSSADCICGGMRR
ncbi:hypothetical protein N7474_009504 [Penicillium riverlandense]|uniref:uncharacterized protein n=1 Tax=Penicillium riverlandense TaxID=1903569 RepID=UPI002546B8BF|nr:uncharacterized protein N7474_009504 [Penicillium riverlandense]KAJ5808235.1 hypothetical protein N7474_009504 [Penicillium riverlandense]